MLFWLEGCVPTYVGFLSEDLSNYIVLVNMIRSKAQSCNTLNEQTSKSESQNNFLNVETGLGIDTENVGKVPYDLNIDSRFVDPNIDSNRNPVVSSRIAGIHVNSELHRRILNVISKCFDRTIDMYSMD